MISGKVLGVDKVLKKLDRLQADMVKGQVRAVARSILLIHEYAVKTIQDNADGKSQIRYAPKRVVNVSNPGEPPNSDTGRLAQSVKFDFQKAGLVGRVGSNLKYAAWLEFGTLTMAPRPWLSEAVEQTSKEVADIFEEETAAAIKEAII